MISSRTKVKRTVNSVTLFAIFLSASLKKAEVSSISEFYGIAVSMVIFIVLSFQIFLIYLAVTYIIKCHVAFLVFLLYFLRFVLQVIVYIRPKQGLFVLYKKLDEDKFVLYIW